MYSIVAIHGLDGHRLKSFAENKEIWLRDFLPHDEAVKQMNPRVSTFGYDAAVPFTQAIGKVGGFSRQLLEELRNLRRQRSTGVPIVILAHSLGGLVAKKV